MERRSVEISVGIFVILGVLALLFVSMQAANLGDFSFNTKTYEVTANFDNIGGLKPRAAVKSAGVVVGRVHSITLDPQTYQAKVTLDMDSRYQFPDDTSAQILTSGLLGEQYIGLLAGADDKNLQNGSKIERTQSAIVLENLISQVMYQLAGSGGDKKKE